MHPLQKTPFSVQKCAMGYKEKKKYAFTVQKCAMNLSVMEKIITNQNTHYQIPTTNYQLKICVHCAKVCNKLI